MTELDVHKQILHYQKKLERYTTQKRADDIIHCIHKLKHLPVTLDHLEQTGVGKSVNSLRSYSDPVGLKARNLVSKWKDMVSAADEERARVEQEKEEREERKRYEHEIKKKNENKKKSTDVNESNKHSSSKTDGSSSHKDINVSSQKYQNSVDESHKNGKDSERKSKSKHHKSKSHHKDKNKESHKHSKEAKSSIKEKSHKDKSHKNSDKVHSKTNSNSQDNSHDKHKKSNKKSKRKVEESLNDFDMALNGLPDYPPSKKKKISKPKRSIQDEIQHDLHLPSPSFDSSPEISSANSTLESIQLSTKYNPLPQISNRNVHDSKSMNDGLSFMLTSKSNRQRTIYSGKGTFQSQVPSLFDMSMKVLQDHVDALEVIGGVPYDIIKPVLSAATPEQLERLEYYNPYLLEDTAELWKIHCNRHFKNAKLEDMESYRDLYIRMTAEKEYKLRKLTEKLEKKYVIKPDPKRTTKLAEFNSAPTLNFKKRAKMLKVVQEKSPAPGQSSSSKPGPSSASTAPTATLPVPIPLPSRPPVNRVNKKPKVAPVMAKTLQLYKKIRRR